RSALLLLRNVPCRPFRFRSARFLLVCQFYAGRAGARAESKRMETECTEILSVAESIPEFLTLDAIYDEKIFETASLRESQWLRDSQRFSYLDNAPSSDVTTVWIYDLATGERTPLIPVETLYLTTVDMPACDAPGEEENPAEVKTL